MNWVDILVIIVFVLGLFVGWKMGLLGAIFNVVGVIIGIYVATNFSQAIAAIIAEQGAGQTLATVLAYVVIIVGVFVAVQVARRIVKGMLNLVFLGWVDSLGSIAVGVVLGGALAGALILGMARFANDLPREGAAGAIVEMTGFRGNIQGSLVDSNLVPMFVDVTRSLPANALGMVPSDYMAALDQIALLIEAKEEQEEEQQTQA